jgi:hypothetical protein
MDFALTDNELALCSNLPEDCLVGLAAELDLLVPDSLSRATLLAESVERMAERAQQEGLPFSKYDREDLEALSQAQLAALARLCKATPTVDGLLKSGRRVYKMYQRKRPGSQVALTLPMLISAVARFAMIKS